VHEPTPVSTFATHTSARRRHVGLLLMVLGGVTVAWVLAATYGTDLLALQRRAAADAQLEQANVTYSLDATGSPLLAASLPEPAGGNSSAAGTSPEDLSEQAAATFEEDDPTMALDADASGGGGPAGFDEGEAIGSVAFPSLDEQLPVVYDATPAALTVGPGWIPGSAELGTAGNAVISGHRTTYGAPFRNIGDLAHGDRIVVEQGHQRFVYEVRDRFITVPEDTRLTGHTSGARLTLTTCHPIGSARERLIIQAELVEGGDVDAAVHGDDWRVYRSATSRPA